MGNGLIWRYIGEEKSSVAWISGPFGPLLALTVSERPPPVNISLLSYTVLDKATVFLLKIAPWILRLIIFRLINLVLLIQMSRLRIDLVFSKFIKGNIHANNPRIRFGACDERCKRRYRRLICLSVSEGKVSYRKIIIKTSFQNLEWEMDWAWPLQSRISILANQLRSQTTDIGERGLWAGAHEALSSAKG